MNCDASHFRADLQYLLGNFVDNGFARARLQRTAERFFRRTDYTSVSTFDPHRLVLQDRRRTVHT
jgi:hypothetical protein